MTGCRGRTSGIHLFYVSDKSFLVDTIPAAGTEATAVPVPKQRRSVPVRTEW
jgi:hypothetical protein